MSNWTMIEENKREVLITMEGEAWKTAQKKSYKKLTKNLEIKGFRKGHVPANMLSKYVDDKAVQSEAIQSNINEYLVIEIMESGYEVLEASKMDIVEVNEEKAVVKITVSVIPDFELGDYKAFDFTVTKEETTDADVESKINELCEKNADLEIKEDGEVAEGDTAVIDFEGFLNDVAFEGGKGENHPLVIGSNSFIPGFETQLVGMKQNEEKDITVTFPAEYHSEDLKGKEVVFKVKVNEIKTKVLPEINDELAVSANVEGVTTLEDLKAHYRKLDEETKQRQAEAKVDEEFFNELTKNIDYKFPENKINDFLNDEISRLDQNLRASGFDLESFMKMTGDTNENLRERMMPSVIDRCKYDTAIKQICRNENIQVLKEDVENTYQEIADQYKMDIKEVKARIEEYKLYDDIRTRKANEFLRGK